MSGCAISASSAKPRDLRIPLNDGRLHTDDLTGGIRHQIGLESAEWLAGEIDLSGLNGALVIDAFNEALGDGCSITINNDQSELVLRFNAEGLPQTIDETKAAVRTFTAVVAPQAAADQRESYGLHLPYESKFISDGSLPLVILIHGLDCNRSNWTPMAQMLEGEGFQIAYFAYPSDQSLADSVRALTEEMADFRKAYPDVPVHLVAHSMGSLVARGFVEGPAYSGIAGVDNLIMLAPPNHGSEWARFRAALELEEHFKLWRDEQKWRPTWLITDGLGEAGGDLACDSTFLAQLNARNRRNGVDYTIITGNKHPVLTFGANAAETIATLVPERASSSWGIRQCVEWLESTGADLRQRQCSGDGPVSISSARLDGVDDFVIVPADHTSLYIPTQPGNRPPAWDIVVDRLRK